VVVVVVVVVVYEHSETSLNKKIPLQTEIPLFIADDTLIFLDIFPLHNVRSFVTI